jgi:hypothetical protein
MGSRDPLVNWYFEPCPGKSRYKWFWCMELDNVESFLAWYLGISIVVSKHRRRELRVEKSGRAGPHHTQSTCKITVRNVIQRPKRGDKTFQRTEQLLMDKPKLKTQIYFIIQHKSKTKTALKH